MPAADVVSVTHRGPGLCPRYTARVIRGVKVGPSPEWLVRAARRERRPARSTTSSTRPTTSCSCSASRCTPSTLATLGVRRRQGPPSPCARRATARRSTTLDGQERALASGHARHRRPVGAVALAGVMGGEATEVSDATVDVLLESASLRPRLDQPHEPRNLGLISEASMRFEKRRGPAGVRRRRRLRRRAHRRARAAATVAPGHRRRVPGARRAARRSSLRVGPARTRCSAPRSARDEMAAILGAPRPADESPERRRRSVGHGADLAARPRARGRPHRGGRARSTAWRTSPSTLPAGRGRVGGLTPRAARRGAASARPCGRPGCHETIGLAFADPADMRRMRWELGRGATPRRAREPDLRGAGGDALDAARPAAPAGRRQPAPRRGRRPSVRDRCRRSSRPTAASSRGSGTRVGGVLTGEWDRAELERARRRRSTSSTARASSRR